MYTLSRLNMHSEHLLFASVIFLYTKLVKFAQMNGNEIQEKIKLVRF